VGVGRSDGAVSGAVVERVRTSGWHARAGNRGAAAASDVTAGYLRRDGRSGRDGAPAARMRIRVRWGIGSIPARYIGRQDIVRRMTTTRGMTQAAFFVLTALADEPRHGYGILQEVDELSGEEVQLRVGTLYGVLDRLSGDGLIVLDREEVQQGRLRRYYRLTEEGAAVLAAEAERMVAGARAARERMAAGRRAGTVRPAGGTT
jgi:DNA-binding PadR family transcriptional regulator